MQTSSFLGQSLKRNTPIQPTQAPRAAPVQAFFKKAEKEVKKAAPKGNVTQVNAAGRAARQALSQGPHGQTAADPRLHICLKDTTNQTRPRYTILAYWRCLRLIKGRGNSGECA